MKDSQQYGSVETITFEGQVMRRSKRSKKKMRRDARIIREMAGRYSPDAIAEVCGVTKKSIEQQAGRMGVSLFVQASSNATAKSEAMANRAPKRSHKQVVADAKWARDSIADGMSLKDTAKLLGIVPTTLSHQLRDYAGGSFNKIHGLKGASIRKRIAKEPAKKSLWQRIKEWF